MSVKEKMTAIADTIRSHTGGTDKLFLDDMPREIENACAAEHEKGYENGYADGQASAGSYESGFEDGKTQGKLDEYDRFWDAYQQNGNRNNYENAFGGLGWTDETFKPKYDITDANLVLYMNFRKCGIVDLGEAIRKSGKRFISNAERMQYTFNSAYDLEVIDGIDFTNSFIQISGAFESCTKLRKIQTLPISEKATQLYFDNIPALEEISFSGVIPVSLSFQRSTKLNKASITSIVNALSDTATGQTLTLSQTAVDTAFYVDEASGAGSDSGEWTSLVNAKPNWTISLV